MFTFGPSVGGRVRLLERREVTRTATESEGAAVEVWGPEAREALCTLVEPWAPVVPASDTEQAEPCASAGVAEP